MTIGSEKCPERDLETAFVLDDATCKPSPTTIWSDECSECDRGPDQINSQKKIGEKCPTPSRRVRENRLRQSPVR